LSATGRRLGGGFIFDRLEAAAAQLFCRRQPRRAVGCGVRLNSFIEFYGDINRKIEAGKL